MSDHLSYMTNTVSIQYILRVANAYVPERDCIIVQILEGLVNYIDKDSIISSLTGHTFVLFSRRKTLYDLDESFFRDSSRPIHGFHAIEMDSFREYALPSHSWSEGNGSCRSLQVRAPYFSISIITQTTNNVRQAVAGQKTCKPIMT